MDNVYVVLVRRNTATNNGEPLSMHTTLNKARKAVHSYCNDYGVGSFSTKEALVVRRIRLNDMYGVVKGFYIEHEEV